MSHVKISNYSLKSFSSALVILRAKLRPLLPFTALDLRARIGHKALRAFAERAALLRNAHGARPAGVRVAGVGHNAARLWGRIGDHALRALALGRPLLATQIFTVLLPCAFYLDKRVKGLQ